MANSMVAVARTIRTARDLPGFFGVKVEPLFVAAHEQAPLPSNPIGCEGDPWLIAVAALSASLPVPRKQIFAEWEIEGRGSLVGRR